MSKHASAEAKLHISPNLRIPKIPKQKLTNRSVNEPPGPPKGTNSNNQYR
jgi:hypothetical protein